MKKLAAILLLGIFSFNLFGYRLVAILLERSENTKMELAFDEEDYTDNQLISIKQPTNLPYYQNSKSFQRVDGEIEIGGIYYKYVKCRIYNDSLELLCMPNMGKMRIQAAKVDFSKQASDYQQPENKKSTQSDLKSFHKIISDFEEQSFTRIACVFSLLSPGYLVQNPHFVKTPFAKSIEQPPDHFTVIS